MKSIRAFLQSLLLPVALIATSSLTLRCASDGGGGQQGDPVQSEGSQDGQGEEGQSSNASLNGQGVDTTAAAQGESMNNAVEGGSSENFGAANGGNAGALGGNSGNDAELGESMNNVPLENPAALITTPNTALNQAAPLAETPPLNPTAIPTTETPPTNAETTAIDPAIPPTTESQSPAQPAAAGSGDATARAAASPFQNPHMNWPGKGKVKYVTRQLTRHSAPNGPVVGEFEQGEHPLIYQNGNWAELNDGSFVKGNGLSEKAIGYNKGKANWQK